jgi:hypothetical protein
MFRYVWRFSSRRQLLLLALIVASYPVQFLIYDATKVIVNRAIGGEGPPFSASFLGLPPISVDIDRVSFLLVLCFVFLLAVLLNNGFKTSSTSSRAALPNGYCGGFAIFCSPACCASRWRISSAAAPVS